jgi:hypothetical protein
MGFRSREERRCREPPSIRWKGGLLMVSHGQGRKPSGVMTKHYKEVLAKQNKGKKWKRNKEGKLIFTR